MYTAATDSDNCPCGSQHSFANCCNKDPSSPPKGVVLIQHAVPDKTCDNLVKYLKNQPKQWLEIIQGNDASGNTVSVKDPSRRTEAIHLGKFRKKISMIVEKNLKQIIQDQLGATLQWYEAPDVMYYSAGGLYQTHSDSENFNSAAGVWQKFSDRDYSLLIYLSDDFEGGQLSFNRFGYSHTPQKGDLIFFPSDNRYLHTADPVTAGNRYVIVSWCATKESNKHFSSAPATAVMVD